MYMSKQIVATQRLKFMPEAQVIIESHGILMETSQIIVRWNHWRLNPLSANPTK